MKYTTKMYFEGATGLTAQYHSLGLLGCDEDTGSGRSNKA